MRLIRTNRQFGGRHQRLLVESRTFEERPRSGHQLRRDHELRDSRGHSGPERLRLHPLRGRGRWIGVAQPAGTARWFYLPKLKGSRAVPLRRRRLEARSGVGGYDENWLQRLLFETPEVLPIGEIDPAFAPAVPLCRELPTAAGFHRRRLRERAGAVVDPSSASFGAPPKPGASPSPRSSIMRRRSAAGRTRS